LPPLDEKLQEHEEDVINNEIEDVVVPTKDENKLELNLDVETMKNTKEIMIEQQEENN